LIELVRAIQSEDVERLATIPGIGRKRAARIALETQREDRENSFRSAFRNDRGTSGFGRSYDDALSALVNLGYRPQDVKDALKRISKTVESQVVSRN